MKIGALLLAAGAARRFGSDKRLSALSSGETLVGASLAAYLRVPGSCTVVLDRQDDKLASQLARAGATVVRVQSREAPLGMGDSLAEGMREIARQGCDGCLIGLADMPWISDETLTAIVNALRLHPLVVPAWRGRWGHPVGFSARFFPELCQLGGDRGARALLQAHAAERFVLPVADRAVVMDVDTPADLRGGLESKVADLDDPTDNVIQ